MLLDKFLILSGGMYILTLGLGKFWIFDKWETEKVSHFVAVIATFMALYMICALGMVFSHHSTYFRIAMLFFGLSPFLLGHVASYHTEKIYSSVQVLLVVISVTMCLVYS